VTYQFTAISGVQITPSHAKVNKQVVSPTCIVVQQTRPISIIQAKDTRVTPKSVVHQLHTRGTLGFFHIK